MHIFRGVFCDNIFAATIWLVSRFVGGITGLEKSNSGICVKQIKVLLSSSVTKTFDISGPAVWELNNRVNRFPIKKHI